jgi:predicted nucleic acid-binding protein
VLLVDTGAFLASADRREAQYSACVEVMRANRGELAVTAPVVAESAWIIERRLGVAAEAAFLRLVTTSAVRVVDLTADDYERCVALVEQYADLGLGFVDASIVAVAERTGVVALATLDHRDFRAVRPSHVAAFDLVS